MLLFILFFLIVTPIFAADPISGAAAIRKKLQGVVGIGDDPTAGTLTPQANPIKIAGQVVRGALALLGLIFFTLMIYGGSLYLTAGGNEEQVKKARHVLTRAAIGGLIVIFAGAITQFLTGQLARPVVPAEELPSEVNTSAFGGCPEGYRYIIDPSSGYDLWNWDAKCRRIQ